LDQRISQYAVEKYTSPLVITDNTRDVLQAGFLVDEAWLAPAPDAQPGNEWFEACAVGDTAFVKENYDVFNRKVDDRQCNYAEGIYAGFAGIHYAAINNHPEII